MFEKTKQPETTRRPAKGKELHRNGQAAGAVRKLAMSQWQAGRRIEAQMTLAAGLRKFPSAGSLHVQMGLFHAAEEEYDQAKESFLAALRIDETNADAHRYLGLTHAATGALSPAVGSFQRAYELLPENQMVAVQLSLAAKAAGEVGCTVPLRAPGPQVSQADRLSRLVVEEADFVDSLLALPESEGDAEVFGALLEAVERALETRPGHADLRLQASRICLRLGRMDDAIAQGRLATQLNPQYAA
ncbi:MAG: tetratricopeptide repeat protein, partial [Planctomycetota bacterium]